MTAPFSLTDTFSYEGFWWLPSNPEERIAGTLSFSQGEGASLRLLGLFGGLSALNNSLGERDTIHGITKDGKLITLLDAFAEKRQMNAPGIMNEQYYVHLACVGHHFLSSSEEIFSRSSFRFERLEEWLKNDHFQQIWDRYPNVLGLEVARGTDEKLASFSGLTIGKSSAMQIKATSTEHNITVLSNIFCESDNPRSVVRHFDIASKMQELASLCSGHYLPMTHIRVTLAELVEGETRHREVVVFAQMQHPQASARPRHEEPLLAMCELLESDGSAVEVWFQQYETLSPAINLFFAVTGEKKMFSNVRFLLAIQALEVFHRRTNETTFMGKAAFKKLRQTLVEAIPDDAPERVRDNLTRGFAHANEPSLMERLTSMISEVNRDFGEQVVGFSGRFARNLVDTRNYNTHFTAALEAKALDGAEMHYATRRMILLLTYLLLRRIGVGAAAFRQALHRHQEFQKLFIRAGAAV